MLTIPNLVSLLRLLLVPVFLWLLFGRDDPAAAGWLLAVIGATDWVDGYLARRLDQVSELGKLLDPVADRLAVGSAVVGGWIAGVLNPWFAGTLVAREVLIGLGSIVVGVRAGTKIAVRRLGKLATLLLYAAIAWFFIGTSIEAFTVAAWIVGIPGLVLYYIVAVQYLGDARKVLANPPVESAH